MADFRDPKYASYLEVVREAAVERQPHDDDYFVQFEGDRKPVVKGPIQLPTWQVGPWPEVVEYGFSEFWLPTLADWLEMLSQHGEWVLYQEGLMPDGSGRIRYAAELDLPDPAKRLATEDYVRAATTPEEAAARLWIAVTGHTEG